MSAKSEMCLQLRFYRGLYTILYLYFGSSDQLINLSQYHNRSVDLFLRPKQVVFGSIYYLKQYLVVVFQFLYSICIPSQLKCILMFTVCFDFATVVALRHPTILTVLGSLPPLCTILYRLGMTGTLSRPNCVIFTSDLLPATHLHQTDSKPS